MQDAQSFTPEEIAELRRLLEIEKVRKLAQLYSHLMDSRDWDAMARLYAEDAVCEWGPYGSLAGRENIRKQLIAAHPGRLPYDGMHITTNLWVELTGPNSARSRNYLTDMWPSDEIGPISHPGYPANPVVLYAIYENEYRKTGPDWQISRSEIHFVWPQRITSQEFPRHLQPTAIG